MRGATRDECRRVAMKGDTFHVICSTVVTRHPGNTEVVYALGKIGASAQALVFATAGTLLRVTDVSRAVWPAQIRTIFGNQAEGTELLAWTYPARRTYQSVSEPPLACLCFFRSDPWTVIQLSDLGGVRVEIIGDPPPSFALPTAEAQNQALAPVL